MSSYLSKKLVSEIGQALVKEPQILAGYVVGSIVNGEVGTKSDFDLAVIDKTSSPLFRFQMISKGKRVYERSSRLT